MNWFGGIEKYYQKAFKKYCSVCDIIYYPSIIDIYLVRKIKQFLKLKEFERIIPSNIKDNLLNKEFRNRLFEKLKTKYNLIFIIKGDYLDKELLRELKEFHKAIYAIYFIDNPFWALGKERMYLPTIIDTLPLYDYIFSFDTYYLPLLKKLSMNDNVYHLPFASDLDYYYPINKIKNEYIYNISFVGSATYEREKFFSELSESFSIHIFGNCWDKKLFKDTINKIYSSKEVNEIFNNTKINLNLNVLNSIYGTNMRTFEIISSGGFLLNDYKLEIEELFKINQDLVCYNDIFDLKEKINYYLKNESLRLEIAKNGYNTLLNNHTYNHRVEYLLRIFQKNGKE